MTYTYAKKQNPPFVPFECVLRQGEKIAKGSLIQQERPLKVKRITSVEVLASGAKVIGKGLPR